jgi:hypothetical protein
VNKTATQMFAMQLNLPKSNLINLLKIFSPSLYDDDKKYFLGENPIGLAAYGAGESATAKNQSIYVQALLLLLSATYQFISILQTS